MKLSLRKILRAHEALTSISKIGGFEIGPSFKMSLLKNELEGPVQAFQKERDRLYLDKKLEETDKLKEGIDFVFVGIKGVYNIPVTTEDFDVIDGELNKLLDDGQESYQTTVTDRLFSLKDFQTDVLEDSEDGKKKVKRKVSLVNTGFLAAMQDFIKQED